MSRAQLSSNDMYSFQAGITIYNCGLTPAILTRVDAGIDKIVSSEYMEEGLAKTRLSDVAYCEIHRRVLGPKDSIDTVVFPPRWYSLQEYERSDAGDLLVMVFGTIEYRDVSGETHTSDFCWLYAVADDKFVVGHDDLQRWT